ncbi:cupin domain-containing protein [Paenibacillus sp. CC-CFT747]|nr:cupin domain-containing protein [Paenibacillus sp. CC-CFT747]
MNFSRYSLQETITVKHLISFHYFEYAKGFVFEGEQHDFWEFLYVDKGEVEVRADERTLELKQGSLIVHKPNEFHTVRVRQEHKPPNLIVISFECSSPALKALGGRVMNVGDRERNWLSLLLQEGFQAFKAPFDKPNDHTLVRRKEAAFGSEHLIKLYLEALLIHLCRSEASADSREPKLSLLPKERSEEQLVQQITDFMRRDLSRPFR